MKRIVNTIKYIYERLILKYGGQDLVIKTFRRQGARIGEGCRIYTTSLGTEPYLVKIGNRVAIANNVTFITHNLTWTLQEKYESLTAFGKIEIKDNCNIGVNVTILPNVTIGPNSVVGAGSVVTKDVKPEVVVAGNPARVICDLDTYEKKCLQRHIDIPLNREQAKKILIKKFWGDEG